mmetsp:Transcript_80400/g.211154  ORF Transcript_80400/g.211154 Transcript_80400/m.211154 type:complete len:146 (+) Transcript_80400:79-516(+)
MFGLLHGLYQWMVQKEERRMVLLGVDNAGKTTTLEQLKSRFGAKGMPVDRIPPTIGFNVGRIQIDKVVAVFWDLGGHASFRRSPARSGTTTTRRCKESSSWWTRRTRRAWRRPSESSWSASATRRSRASPSSASRTSRTSRARWT